MRVCLSIPEVDTGLVLDTTMALARYNARTYSCGPSEKCTRSPWHLAYDATLGDSVFIDGHPTIVMRDAVALLRVGSGACGELSAAYAGWLMARGAKVELVAQVTGQDAWHVVVRVGGGVTIDPARPGTVEQWRYSHGMR